MGELIVIFGFVLIAGFVALTIGSRIHQRDLAFKERKLELEASKGSVSSQKIEMLEQRVRVLERLATDRGQDLALQIENLRGSSDTAVEFAAREKAQ